MKHGSSLTGSGNVLASASAFSHLQELMVRRGQLINRRATLMRNHHSAAVTEKKLVEVTAEIIAEETRIEEQQMRLEEWDKKIAPRLQDIEYSGNTIARHARYIQANAEALPARPAWEAKARESLGQAEIDLRTALALIQMAQRRYDAMQIISEAAE